MELLKKPESAVYLQVTLRSDFAAPGIIDNYGSANLCSLNDGLSFTPIPSIQSGAFNQVDLNGALVVVIAGSHECEILK